METRSQHTHGHGKTEETQVSAGGVAFRTQDGVTQVALIAVGKNNRWQLPKGTVDPGESIEEAALREVREEAGIHAALLNLLDRIEYWYYSSHAGKKIRHHKFVYFYLMKYVSGDPHDHDDEVNEARWVEAHEALAMLTFANEKNVLTHALEILTNAPAPEHT